MQQRYPFDAQNKRNFEKTTDAICEALEEIRKNPDLKATRGSLAKRAGVARKTLYNRGWPNEELDKIKEKRREAEKISAQKEEADSEAEESQEEKLEAQVENLRTEAAILFHDLEDARKKIEALERENKALQSENCELKSQLNRAKISERKARPNGNLSLVPDFESTDKNPL